MAKKLSIKSLMNMYGGAKIKTLKVPKVKYKKLSLPKIKAFKLK